LYNQSGGTIGNMQGSIAGLGTVNLGKNSGNAFWSDIYRTDASIANGGGLTITSATVNFY
jgi:hypothetical protein